MCGIAGFFGDFDRALLERMADSIAHRGPDDAGFELLAAERIGLAHRRLSIIDLSPAGHQPMWDPTRSVAITTHRPTTGSFRSSGIAQLLYRRHPTTRRTPPWAAPR